MNIRSTSIVYRLLGVTLLAALLLALAPGALQAQDAVPGGGTVILLPETLDADEPDLTTASNSWTSGGQPIVPGSTWTITFQSSPIQSASGEEVDSWYLNGPTNGTTAGSWTIASIGNAPANNRGNGLPVDDAYQQPQTGLNTSFRAHAYWGYQPSGQNAFNYVNAATITPPTRSWVNNTPWGVYNAEASPGGAQVAFATTFNVPTTWTSYLCPGALAPNDQWIGLSGVDTNPNWMQGWLYSSDCSSVACPVDAGLTPIRACRQPSVSVAKTGTVTGISDPLPQGGPGTVTVRYCFVVTNATTPGAGVHLASYRVTDSSIGYDSGTVVQALAPGASAPQICAPNYTYNVTWPVGGNVCVTNASGASATGTTPSGWGETTAGDPASGFSTRTFTSAAATGGVGLQICASPFAITLAEFSAAQQGDAILIMWETASELDNRGFNLYRGTSPDGWDRQLNAALIPSQSQGSPSGFTYSWEDRADLAPGTTYYYWLEDVSLSGATTLHGPVSVDFTVPTAVTLSGVNAGPAAAASLPWLWVLAAASVALGLNRRRPG